jgi:hypothetical protein
MTKERYVVVEDVTVLISFRALQRRDGRKL